VSDELLEAVEADIIARLATIPAVSAPGRVSGWVSLQEALGTTHIVAPAVRVEYAGERISKPLHVGTPVRQMARVEWDVFAFAQSFSHVGEGRNTQPGRVGAYDLFDAVFAKLEGFELGMRGRLTDGLVGYTLRWYHDVVRTEPS
jgi:hypothetical protein